MTLITLISEEALNALHLVIYDFIYFYGGRRKYLAYLKSLDPQSRLVFLAQNKTKDMIKSRDFLINYHKKLVTLCLQSRYGESYYNPDFTQAGLLGLVRALETYNPHKKYKFSTFAVPIIKFALIDATKESNIIKLPYKITKLKTILALTETLEQRQSKIVDLLALGYTAREINYALTHLNGVVSLEILKT